MNSNHEQPVPHDEYGFRLDCSTAQLEARHHCDQAQSQVAAKWDKLQAKVKTSREAAKDSKLKKQCRTVRLLPRLQPDLLTSLDPCTPVSE